MARDLRTDTALTRRSGPPRSLPRRHPRRLEGRLRLRRCLDVRRAARDGGGARPRRPTARDRERDLPRAGAARTDHHRRRRAARRPHARRRSPPTSASPAARHRHCACTACSASRTTPISRFQDVRFPEVPRPADVRLRRSSGPIPFGTINFHEQTEWRADQLVRRSRFKRPLHVMGAPASKANRHLLALGGARRRDRSRRRPRTRTDGAIRSWCCHSRSASGSSRPR